MLKGWVLLGWASLVGACAVVSCDSRNIAGLVAGAGGEGVGGAGGDGLAGEGGEADAPGGAAGTPASFSGAAGAPDLYIATGTVFELDPQIESFDPDCHAAGCHEGPWFLQFQAMSGDELVGTISDKVQANTRPLHLRALSDGYHLEGELVLSTYYYELEPAPGLCAEAWLLKPEDTDGDEQADRLTITGTIASEGGVSAEWETECGNLLADYPQQISWTAERIDAPPWKATATSDALSQRFYPSRLLVSGAAELEVEGVWSAAKPLLEDGVIYGFESALTLSPGSQVSWRSSGVGFDQQAVESPVLTVDVDEWAALADGSFESYAVGTELAGGAVTGELHPTTGDAIVPLRGSRSLLLPPGDEVRLRLSRPAGSTRLGFLLSGSGSVASRFGLVGQPARTDTSSQLECVGELSDCVRRMRLELPEEGAELLLGVTNEVGYGAATIDVWLDDIVFE